jgi:hypothetical protein
MLTVVPDPIDGADGESGSSVSLLDELVREGARRMLAAALEAEVAAYIDAHAGQVDEQGRRLVVRNGHHTPRQVLTGAGAVEVVAPPADSGGLGRNRADAAWSIARPRRPPPPPLPTVSAAVSRD